ncbi:MAG: tRNA glutamyl-Q(34) synthetase GluQRS [Ilumatobacteraceae bacterium]
MRADAGRFAPSPSGDLHLGNLRTALIAWLSARSAGLEFIVRMEDLDRVTSSVAHEAAQLRQLAAIGIDWDGAVVRQSERFTRYDEAIAQLAAAGCTYECFCTRREIREAAAAPNGQPAGSWSRQSGREGNVLIADGAYPGTCRGLSDADRQQLRAVGREPAIRLRADGVVVSVEDLGFGTVRGAVDDVVLRRNDGVPAYNLAVVVDDAAQGVGEVVRGDDLLASTPRQVRLQQLLGVPTPRYRHVPLVLGADGVRLAKRHGAVTLADLAARGIDADNVRSMMAASIDLTEPGEPVTMIDLLARFDPNLIRREPWILPIDLQRSEL